MLSGSNYAVPAGKIQEIIRLPSLITLEKLPDYIVGLLNLRSKVIRIIDVRKFLGINISGYSTDHQVLIVKNGDMILGLIADSVDNVVQMENENIETLPYNSQNKYIQGIYNDSKKIIALLNLDSILHGLDNTEYKNDELHVNTNQTINLFPSDPISSEKFAKRALSLQKEIKMEINKNDYSKDRYVSFSLNNEKLCISLKYVKEFTKLKNINITPLPCVPDFIAGLINLRGDFITIFDIKEFLQIPKSELTEKTKIIVVRTNNIQIGLLVDDVFDMIDIPVDKLNSDKSAKYDKDKFTIGEVMLEDGGVMSVLNLEKFLEDERIYIEDAV
jgi:purine-binding chemotaxis protein CheW